MLPDSKIEGFQLLDGLSAQEGFVLSRAVKGMKIHELRSLLPWPEEETNLVIQTLIDKGALALEGKKIPEHLRSVLEEDSKATNLEYNFCAEILVKADGIEDRNPYEILEVSRSASTHEIRNQYLTLSKKFHPDRFFRKDLGPFKERLNFIFSKLQKSYSILKDPHEREAVDRRLSMGRAEAVPKSKGESKTKEELLKKLKALDPHLEKMVKAEQAFKEGQKHEREADFIAALSCYSLAAQLNPEKTKFQRAHDAILPLSAKQKAEKKTAEALSASKARMIEDVFKSADEALRLDPQIPEAQLLWSKAVIELKRENEFRAAKERLLRAKAALPKNPEPCFLLGKLLAMSGEPKLAKRELQEALQRDPKHVAAQKLLGEI